jgi:chromosome segregation ATPase
MKGLGLTAVLCLCAVAAAAKQRQDGYILHLDARRVVSSLDLDSYVAVDKSLRGPVLWVRRGGRHYEIRDASILDRAAEALRPVTAVNDEYAAFERRARPVYDEEEELDRQIDAIEDRDDADGDDGDRDETRLADLRAQRRDLRERLRAVEAEDHELDARQEAADAELDRFIARLVDEAMRQGLARPID